MNETAWLFIGSLPSVRSGGVPIAHWRPVPTRNDTRVTARLRFAVVLITVVAIVGVLLMGSCGRATEQQRQVAGTATQSIWLVGTDDPALGKARQHITCSYDGVSRYGNGACSP
jgi:hypothetical protein